MKAKKMQTKRVIRQVFCMLLSVALLCVQFSVLPINNAVADTAVTAVNFDPNNGAIRYGCVGDVGAGPEHDLNNENLSGQTTINFPADVIKYFEDYDPNNPYYDYAPLLSKAIALAYASSNGKDVNIFCAPGVYYCRTSVALGGYYVNINGVYGKTIFVAEPNHVGFDGVEERPENGFFTNDNFKNNLSWLQSGSITDITIVAAGAHPTFKPTSSAQQIMANVLSDDIQPVSKYHAFYRVCMKYFGLSNITISGFDAAFNWTKFDMLARVSNCTIGPTRVVLWGVETNDAFINDNYFYGGCYTNDLDLTVLPTFMHNFSAATTYITNSYLENYIFADLGVGGCWCPYATYSNLTMNRVYSIGMDSTSGNGNSMSGCLIQNCGYNDIKAYFEGLGIEPFNYDDRYWDNGWHYPSGYAIVNSTWNGDARLEVKNGKKINIFNFVKGNAVTQNKIVCNDMEKTILIRIGTGANGFNQGVWGAYGDRYFNNLNFSDNAFDVRNFNLEKLVVDEFGEVAPNGYSGGRVTRNNCVLSPGWSDNIHIVKTGDGDTDYKTQEDPEDPVCWLEDGVYLSLDINRYIDLSAFISDTPNSVGYTKPVGVNEENLIGMEKAYYNDVKNNTPMVFLKKDFGGRNYGAPCYLELQRAFDYAATHDAILYIDSGDFYTDMPIVLRGGAHYRVVFGGRIVATNSTPLNNKGLFVMSADDNDPISGYFYNTRLFMQNYDVNAFYNVNFEDMWLTVGTIGSGEGGFVNCNFKDSILANGQIQYCDRGVFWRTTFKDSLFKNVYITGSTFEDKTINDKTYRTYICESDLIDSTMRANWLEFGQFSDGKKLTGQGNSVYRGNLLDYTYNYSFGENDVFVGNTQTRADKGQIGNHMLNSNFPIDCPDALKNVPMVMYHISDGVKIIGNALSGTMTPDTHFVEFDSPTIKYKDANGREVVSISNARVVANLAYTNVSGQWASPTPVVEFDNADNIVYENCLNNQLPMQLVRLISDGAEPMQLSKDIVLDWAVPGANLYINGTHHIFTINDYVQKGLASSSTPQQLTRVAATSYPQTDIWDVNNYYDFEQADTEVKTYNFMTASTQEAAEMAEDFADKIDILKVESRSSYKDPVYNIATNIDGYQSFHIDSTVSIDHADNPIRNTQKPGYALIFDDYGDNLLNAKMSVWQDMVRSFTWVNSYPTYIIYAEDDENYYGITFQVELYRKNRNETRASDVIISKEDFGITIPTQNKYRAFSFVDPATELSVYNVINSDYLNQMMFTAGDQESDCEIWGVDIECAYRPENDAVVLSLVLDMRYRGTDESVNPPAITTTRRVELGSFPMADRSPVLGYFSNWEAWVETVELEYTTETPSACDHDFTSTTVREATCTKHGVVEKVCNDCGYSVLEKPAATGHNFEIEFENPSSSDETPYIKHSCSVCNFAYREDMTVSSIEISQSPKTQYAVGQSLDVSTGKLMVTLSDGLKTEIAMTADMISGFDTGSTGSKNLTVTYSGCTTNYDINVTQTPVNAPTPEVYFVGWDKIVINTVPGYLYSTDRVNWQSQNTFTGLTANTQYSIYARDVSDTGLSYVSQPVNVTTVANGSTPVAPTSADSYFSGWKVNGGNYTPKFVNKAVLCAKVQLSNRSNATTAAIRLLSTIDSLKYQSAGFIIGDNGYRREITTVYSEIYASNSNGASSVTAAKISGTHDSSYIICVEITNIPASNYNTDITFTPFWTTLDGLTICGAPRTVRVSDLMR